MTIVAQRYKRETENLIRYYEGRDSPVLKYISVTKKYVTEVEKRGFLELLDELEHQNLFQSCLCLLKETYRPDQFFSVLSEGYIKCFSPEFMGYILACRKQLKRKLNWKELCDLYYAYDIWRIQWLLSVHFCGDSLQYAVKNVSLKELWKYVN